MSTAAESNGAHHEELVHGSDHGPVDLPHASLKGYLTGFFLSVILTVIPFWLVMGNVMNDKHWTIFLIAVLGVMQVYVHIIFFLHMNSKSENGWNLMALIFSVIIVLIVFIGSIWIMANLRANMHPKMNGQQASQMQQRPIPGVHY